MDDVNEETPSQSSPEDREYFTRVMDEAQEERSHKERLAKIQAQKEVDLARVKQLTYEQREWRKHLTIGILVGVFILAAIAAFWYGSLRIHESDRVKFQNQTAQQTETAQKCIEEGNIWLDGNCLLAKKG